jgi:hypothetical protein
MGAITVQAKYEKTADPKRMMSHALLTEAIRKDWDAIKAFLPARVATYIEYGAGKTKAQAWDEGKRKISIDLPLKDGWYVPDGNPFAIPNGRKSDRDNPDALFLVRYQNRAFSGPLARDFVGHYFDGRRGVYANDDWSGASGVALIGGRGAAAPLETGTQISSTAGLALIRNPTELIIRGTPEQLDAAVRLLESLKH